MKIAIGSTKAGLSLKEGLIAHLRKRGFEIDDLGMQKDGDFVPYYESAASVARAVSLGRYEKAIIICGTGAGSVIVANKFRGVYAAFAGNEYEARQAKAINDANVICLGEWITPVNHAVKILDAWLDANFGEGFEEEWQAFLRNSVDKVKQIEQENLK